MKLSVFVLFLYPAIFTIIAAFNVGPDFVPLLLLIFLIYTKSVSDEDLGRIEHKIDSVFEILPKESKAEKNYDNLHKSAWDHDYPMLIEEDMLSDSKARQNIILIVGIINKLTFFLLSIYWIFISLMTE